MYGSLCHARDMSSWWVWRGEERGMQHFQERKREEDGRRELGWEIKRKKEIKTAELGEIRINRAMLFRGMYWC